MKLHPCITTALLACGIALVGAAHAEQKYNPYAKQWETVAPGAHPEYNPYSEKWENGK